MGQRDKHTNGSLKGQILIDEKNGQILGYPLQQGYGVPNIMAGNFVGPGGVVSPTTSGSPGGFRVAKPGFDVRVATAAQLIFDSNQNVFKIAQSGSAATTALSVTGASAGTWTSNSVTDTIPHGLGFTPAAHVYFQSGSNYYPLPNVTIPQAGSGSASASFFQQTFSLDSNNLYITSTVSIYGTATGFFLAGRVKYYLLQETAN